MVTNQREKVLEEKRHVSSKISDLCRYIGFGVIAATWTMLTSTSSVATTVTANHHTALWISAASGMATILFDYLQFLAGYVSVNKALSRADDKYDDTSPAYLARPVFFWLKQTSAVASISVLIWIVLSSA